MLVLTRRLGQSLVITVPGYRYAIRVVVTQLDPDQAQLGIDAPREVTVLRGEATDDGRPR